MPVEDGGGTNYYYPPPNTKWSPEIIISISNNVKEDEVLTPLKLWIIKGVRKGGGVWGDEGYE